MLRIADLKTKNFVDLGVKRACTDVLLAANLVDFNGGTMPLGGLDDLYSNVLLLHFEISIRLGNLEILSSSWF